MAPKPRYSLEAYLVHIRGERDRVMKELAAAVAEVREEERKLHQFQEERRVLETEQKRWVTEFWEQLRKGEIAPHEFEERRNHLDGLEQDLRLKAGQILAQERAVKRAEGAADQVRQETLRISKEVEVHEEKKVEWLSQLGRDAARREQRNLEDLSTSRHARRLREGGDR